MDVFEDEFLKDEKEVSRSSYNKKVPTKKIKPPCADLDERWVAIPLCIDAESRAVCCGCLAAIVEGRTRITVRN